MRVDFHDLISRSRRVALERSGCSSDHTKNHGPFFRVNFPEILSMRLWACNTHYKIIRMTNIETANRVLQDVHPVLHRREDWLQR